MRSLSRTFTIAAVTVLLLATACGGSKAPTAAEDKAMAQRIVLTSTDLPGFIAEPVEDDDDSSSSFDGCLNDNPLLLGDNEPRAADGYDFTKDDGNVRVQSGAFVAEKVSEARKAFTDLENALSSQCLKDGMKRVVAESADPGVTVRDVSASALPELAVAEEFAATRLTVPLEADGERLSVYADLTFVRHGRVLAGVFTIQGGSAFDDAERTRLANLVGERASGKSKNTPETGPPPTTATLVTPTTTARRAVTATTTLASPATSAPTAVTPAGTIRFRDPSGVNLEHPRAWTTVASRGDDPLVVFLDPSSAPFRRNVNIMVQEASRPLTLEEYTQVSLQQLEDMNGAIVGESRPTTLSGSPAYRVAYRGDLGSGDLRFLAVWTVRSGKAYVVTFTSDPARYNPTLPEIERLLTTIQLPA